MKRLIAKWLGIEKEINGLKRKNKCLRAVNIAIEARLASARKRINKYDGDRTRMSQKLNEMKVLCFENKKLK